MDDTEGRSTCCFQKCVLRRPPPTLTARKGSVVTSAGEIPHPSLELSQGMLAGEKPVWLCCNSGFPKALQLRPLSFTV